MKQKMLIAAKYLGFFAFGLLIVVVTVYMAFPVERLKPMIERELSQGGRYQVTIGSLSPAFLAGITVKDLVLISPPERPKDKPDRLVIEEATVRYSVWGLIFGRSKITFSAKAFGGTIEGSTEKRKKVRYITLDVKSMDFKKTPGVAKAVDLPMKGKLSIRGNLTIPPEGLRKAEGKLTLRCAKCTIGDGKTKVKPKFGKRPGRYDPVADKGVTLPEIKLGRFGGDIVIKNGKATFSQFEALSSDGEATLLGSLSLREPFIFSTAQILFKFKFSDEIKKQKPTTLGIESFLGQGKRSDGLFGFCFTGRLRGMIPRPCRYSPVDKGGGARRGGRRGDHGFGRGGRPLHGPGRPRPPYTGPRGRLGKDRPAPRGPAYRP